MEEIQESSASRSIGGTDADAILKWRLQPGTRGQQGWEPVRARHHHREDDELFLALRGRLRMRFRDREVTVDPGEFIIVPRGVEHLPVADEETHVLLIESETTLNTGNVINEKTRQQLDRI